MADAVAMLDVTTAVQIELTEEAALTAHAGEDLRVEMLVADGGIVAQGAPVLRLRRHPEIVLTAPMAARLAGVSLGPGRRLQELILFREAAGGRHRHVVESAGRGSEAALRALILASGLWRCLRSRPYGRMPAPGERPAAIFVMAIDTRPGAPDPAMALDGREEHLDRGLAALLRLTEGNVVLCTGKKRTEDDPSGRLRAVTVTKAHPAGLAGLQIHSLHPAAAGKPVWDIHAEDVAALGELLATGYLPETRLVAMSGPALRKARLVRTQPGADLRGLAQGHLRPGPHVLISGSPLDGREARWLGPRERLAAALPRRGADTRPHWFHAALRGASRPLPVIPTAALDRAMGGAMPLAALIRAISSGDDETAVRLGALSLVEEDLALADYVTCAEPRLAGRLRAMLDRIEAGEAAA